MKKREYYQAYGKEREKPDFRTWLTALFFRIVPKVGPFRAFRFQAPGPKAEKLFIQAFDTSLVRYAQVLNKLRTDRVVQLPDIDFDTGRPTIFGEYGLADQSYSQLLIGLQKQKFDQLMQPLKGNILNFYSQADSSIDPPKKLYDWKKTNSALAELRNSPAVPLDSLKFPVDSTGKVTAKASR